MCELTGKLPAWLDGELAFEDAAEVERHLGVCEECRARSEAYRRASEAFAAYCDAYSDAVVRSKAGSKRSRRALAVTLSAAAAVAAVFLLSARIRVERPATAGSPKVAPAAAVPAPASAARVAQANDTPVVTSPHHDRTKRARVQASASPAQIQNAAWPGDEPTLEIAIPGEAIFAPGALPDGVGITVDVTLAPDGWAQQMQVRPQLAEFERRTTQP